MHVIDKQEPGDRVSQEGAGNTVVYVLLLQSRVLGMSPVPPSLPHTLCVSACFCARPTCSDSVFWIARPASDASRWWPLEHASEAVGNMYKQVREQFKSLEVVVCFVPCIVAACTTEQQNRANTDTVHT